MKPSACLALLLPVIVGATALHSPAFAQVYRWVDNQGVTHFSQTPPPVRDYSVITPKVATPSTPAPAPTRSTPPDPGAAVPRAETLADQCERIAADIALLGREGELRLQTDDGVKLLSEEEKQVLLAERQNWYERNCK